jgi:hypothetical protein
LAVRVPCAIPQLEEAALQYDLVSRLLHLHEADNVNLKARDVIDSRQSLKSTGLALDQDRVASLEESEPSRTTYTYESQ